ncbi:hypothetical protein Bca4012_100751 [Brassica carinata]
MSIPTLPPFTHAVVSISRHCRRDKADFMTLCFILFIHHLRRSRHVGGGGVTEETRWRWYRDGTDMPDLVV